MANDKIVATLDGNFVRMIDVVENPATITDVQKIITKFWRVHARLRHAVNELVLMNTCSN
jgi:hypothetical protein